MEKIALITGASKGIGKELAKVFAKNGYSLILIARNTSELQQIQQDLKTNYHCESKILSIDLDKSESVFKIMETFKDDMSQVEILVNNAGFGSANKFTDISIEETTSMMELNIAALTRLTHCILPHMVEKKRGKILNVASTAAFLPGPYMAVYYASKAYVLSLSQAIREEYKNEGIFVSVLCPGFTKTGFQMRAGLQNTMLKEGVVPVMSPEKVARIAFKGLMKNKRVIIPGILNQLTVFLSWMSPAWITAKVAAVLDKPK